MPFLYDTLSLSQRYLYPYILSLAHTPLSANEILTKLPSLTGGKSIRRQAGLAIVREIRSNLKKSQYILGLRKDLLPDPSKYPVALTDILGSFSYKVRYRGIHSSTGEPIEGFVQVSTDVVFTKADALAVAASYLENDPTAYPVLVTDMTVVGVLRHPNYVIL